jgi:RNA polymerase sigma-70 factor (ECF subfamily)
MEASIDELPDGMREVFVLRDVQGVNTEETAYALDLTEAVVKTRLFRARAALRRDLFERAGIVSTNVFRFLRPRCDRVVAATLERLAQLSPTAGSWPRTVHGSSGWNG